MLSETLPMWRVWSMTWSIQRADYRRGKMSHAAIPSTRPPHPRSRHAEVGPHRHRHAERFRLPDAFRSRRRFSAADDEEGAFALDHLRAALVPPRRHEHPFPQREQSHDLG